MKESVFLNKALQLAKKGGRAVMPNPMVGAVIVKNNRIIGQGYHQKFGGPHAEVNAIKSVKNAASLQGATIYVTLEPCRHHGKTPPCYDAVLNAGITKIVYASKDPFQKGRRTRNLKHQPLPEADKLNQPFFTWVLKKRPFITVKIATSADNYMAGINGQPVHFTSKAQDKLVHQLRANNQAILVSSQTVLNDNPQLNVRHAKGPNPLKVIIDSKLRTSLNAKAYKNKHVLIATCASPNSKKAKAFKKAGLTLWHSPTKTKVSIPKLLAHLAKQNISTLLVEPGPTLLKSLKKLKLIDEFIHLKGRKKLKKGLMYQL